MSGGSLSYLADRLRYGDHFPEGWGEAIQWLLAEDERGGGFGVFECVRGEIEALAQQMNGLTEALLKFSEEAYDRLHAIEWYLSGDRGADTVVQAFRPGLSPERAVELLREHGYER